MEGGGPKAIERQHAKGRLTARERLGRLLVRKGFVRRRGAGSVGPRGEVAKPSLRYVEDPGGRHNEGNWALRLDAALEFLLG
jgi:hypothetical protein